MQQYEEIKQEMCEGHRKERRFIQADEMLRLNISKYRLSEQNDRLETNYFHYELIH